ncbi:hypothetical protein [Specibacter sp. NPDC078692]|uniref:hypothetical protein n=1 Tax=Specibacter sp. NPDC078692 TaxID=3155818 RepID=UPI00343B7E46
MLKSNFTSKPSRGQTLPLVLLIVGVLLGLMTFVFAGNQSEPALVILGGLGAVTAIVLTFIIARNQNADTSHLRHIGEATHDLGEATNQVLEDVRRVLLRVEEQTANHDYGQSLQTSSEESSSVDVSFQEATDEPAHADMPSYAAEAIVMLQKRGANLTFENLLWRPKIPLPAMRGNHGWFVESKDGTNPERWFVRKAKGLTVRKAMPREFLDALETQAPLDLREIKHDFQLRDHGLAAWYARTYDNVLWKVSRSNRNASAGISVTRENPDD